MGTTSGRFGRKFDIVVGRILASVSCPVVRVSLASVSYCVASGCSMLVSSVFRLLSVQPVTSLEDFPRTYVAGMLGHSLVHKN